MTWDPDPDIIYFRTFSYKISYTFLGYKMGCSAGWRLWGRYCYRIIQDPTRSVDQAKLGCRQIGGDLLSVHSQQENDFVKAYAKEVGKRNYKFEIQTLHASWQSVMVISIFS